MRYGRVVFGGNDGGDERHARQHHLAVVGRAQRAPVGVATLSRLHEPRAPLAVLGAASRRRRTISSPPIRCRHRRLRALASRRRRSRPMSRGRCSRVTAYPFSRFTRIEIGGGFNNVDRSRWFVTRQITDGASPAPFDARQHSPRPDVELFRRAGRARLRQHAVRHTPGPMMGRRYRLQVSPVVGA